MGSANLEDAPRDLGASRGLFAGTERPGIGERWLRLGSVDGVRGRVAVRRLQEVPPPRSPLRGGDESRASARWASHATSPGVEARGYIASRLFLGRRRFKPHREYDSLRARSRSTARRPEAQTAPRRRAVRRRSRRPAVRLGGHWYAAGPEQREQSASVQVSDRGGQLGAGACIPRAAAPTTQRPRFASSRVV
jgi:hypothetical protein